MARTHFTEIVSKNGVWDDMMMPLVTGRQGALTLPDYDYTNLGFLFPQNDATEIIYLTAQMPHCRKANTDIYPHLHWRQTASTTVGWKLDYKLFNIGDAVPAGFTTIALSELARTYTSGSMHQLSAAVSPISGSGIGISAMFLGKLYRDDNVTTGDVLAFQFDLHIQIDSLGSTQMYIKD